MSPTIPRVLVLSILLLTPTTEAEELMDPFDLVRQTLKYWRRIYNMYQEEVTLGYCWAEYFLQLGESMEAMSMSRHASQETWDSGCTKDEGCKNGNTVSGGKREDWGISVDTGQHVRNKRYSEILNPTNKDVEEISMIPGKSAERNDDISNVYLKRKSDLRSDGMYRYLQTDKSYEFSGSDNVTSLFPLVFNSSGGESSKDSARSVKSGETKPCTPRLGISRVSLSSGYDLKSIDCQDHEPNHIQQQSSLNFPHFLTSLVKRSSKGTSKTSIQNTATNKTKGSFTRPAISNAYSKPKYNLKSIGLGERGFHRSQRQKNHQFSSTDDVEGSSFYFPSSSNDFQGVSRIPQQTASTIELSAQNSASTNVIAKLDIKSIDEYSVVDDVGGSSTYLPCSSGIFPRNGRSPLWDSTKIVQSPFDLKFKGNRAEDEVSGKSRALEVDTRRKVLYPRTGHATSGSSSRRAFPLQLSHPEGQKLLDVGAFLRWIAPFNQPPFKSRDTINKLDDNAKPGDFRRDTKSNSSNSGFQRVEEQRLGVFKGSHRRSLRRRRDANDGTRGGFLRPLSKTEVPTRSLTYSDKFLRYPPSSMYTESRSSVWGRKIGSWSLEPRDSDAGDEGRRWRPKYIRRSFAESSPSIYSKYYANIRTRKQQSFVHRGTKMSPSFKGIYNILSSFNGDSWIFRPLFNYVFSKSPAKVNGWKRRGKWWRGDNSKQLWIVKDDLYQRDKGSFHREKSVPEEAEEKEPIQYPVGGPSLLPDSYPRFMGDYGSPTSGTSRNSRPSRSSRAKDQGRRSLGGGVEARGVGRTLTGIFDFRAALMGFLKGLGFLVQVGRQIMDYVDSNTALACTKDYLWSKVIQWIEA